MTSPVSGSTLTIRSTSSPNSWMRIACSSYAREHLDGVAPHPELVAREAEVVALVLQLDEAAQDLALVALVAGLSISSCLPYISGEPRP